MAGGARARVYPDASGVRKRTALVHGGRFLSADGHYGRVVGAPGHTRWTLPRSSGASISLIEK
jgi:hypothetical protein